MPHPPTYDQLNRLPAYNRLVVPPDYEDVNGHMNIAHYLTVASWGVEYAFRAAGMAEDWQSSEGLSAFTAEHHLVYLHEVHVGSEGSVRVRFLGRSARAVHVQAYLLDDTTRQVSYTMELISLHVALAARRTATWPEELAASFDRLVAEHGALTWEVPVCGSMALR